MFEAFRDIWNFLTSSQQPWIAKLGIGGVIVFTAIFCELTTGLISGFINNQRIEQLTSIENAIHTPKYDSATVAYLRDARTNVIERGIFPSYTVGGVLSQLKAASNRQIEIVYATKVNPVLASILTIVTTSGLWIVFASISIATLIRSWRSVSRRQLIFMIGKSAFVITAAVACYIVIVPLTERTDTFAEFLFANVFAQVITVLAFALAIP